MFLKFGPPSARSSTPSFSSGALSANYYFCLASLYRKGRAFAKEGGRFAPQSLSFETQTMTNPPVVIPRPKSWSLWGRSVIWVGGFRSEQEILDRLVLFLERGVAGSVVAIHAKQDPEQAEQMSS